AKRGTTFSLVSCSSTPIRQVRSGLCSSSIQGELLRTNPLPQRSPPSDAVLATCRSCNSYGPGSNPSPSLPALLFLPDRRSLFCFFSGDVFTATPHAYSVQ